jgi:hypothetical protein
MKIISGTPKRREEDDRRLWDSQKTVVLVGTARVSIRYVARDSIVPRHGAALDLFFITTTTNTVFWDVPDTVSSHLCILGVPDMFASSSPSITARPAQLRRCVLGVPDTLALGRTTHPWSLSFPSSIDRRFLHSAPIDYSRRRFITCLSQLQISA